ncbi:expressed protein [Phakopsora pachyrhizi]|uniref:Expressed protein n=1 Tax=Phakopsora pachyrhizi TaxID=170000 RepID=A0AAV0BR58_PHAPC|nr:expressed protein [Phakopsora pachyrhizi]
MSRQTDSSSNISTVPSNKSWTGLQIQASQSYPTSRRNCSGPDSQSNALSNLNSDPINLRPPGGNLTFFGPFDTTSPNQILNQPCHSASRSHSKSPHPVTESISPKLACTLEQSPQFDNNHSISIHSPPIWAQQSSQNIAGCPYDTTGGCKSLEAGLTKSGVPQPESNSLSEANRSVLRWQSTDRTMNRFSDYLPSLKARSGNDTSRYALPSPTAASSSFDSLNARTFTTNKRQRGSDDERPGILGGANTNKLTGLPAKVAKCEQARLEGSSDFKDA